MDSENIITDNLKVFEMNGFKFSIDAEGTLYQISPMYAVAVSRHLIRVSSN